VSADKEKHSRQWRLYKTATDNPVVKRELDALDAEDAAELLGEMKAVARLDLRDGGARHLKDDIWEVRSSGRETIQRALFAKLGRYGHVLLAVHVFTKKTQKTPTAKIDLAASRLRDWNARGTAKPLKTKRKR
jgi:phage-related protein